MGGGDGSLFRTERSRGRKAYKVFVFSMVVNIILIWFYRLSHILGSGGGGESRQKVWWFSWIGLFAAEIWFSFYWVITQSVRWNPIYRFPYKEKLSQRYGRELPKVDIFVCTADPMAEPPAMVISTVLSLMAYNYPPEKLSVYLSDDACSILTFYALWEASSFAKHWLPFCRKYGVEPRSPAAFFSKSCETQSEPSHTKNLYAEMMSRINNVVESGKIPAELEGIDGFSRWYSGLTSRNHQQIVKILIDGREPTAVDVDGNPLPTLVYMAREKRPEHHHNFKAGAMNALIRVSSVISNAPIILNVDCDMYSNNSESIRESLCFFMDEKEGHDIAFVQYPQCFDNITKNDLYGNAMNVVYEVELAGLDGCGGVPYIGTGCFHRREALCGRIYSRDYKEDWNKGIESVGESASMLEERAMVLATCTYELNTLWGKEMGLIYGCAVEDIITGLAIQCRAWRSVRHNPQRRGFLGVSPTTLQHTLLQYKRWAEGNFQIALSKHCSFICGHGKLNVGLQMGYCFFNLWAPNSIPTLYYVVVPPLCLLKGISLFPKLSSHWIVPFAYVFIAKNSYSLIESLMFGDTIFAWWNLQRMWLLKRITAFLFATIDNFLKILGSSKVDFKLTSKAIDDQDLSKRYEKEVMEFGSSSPMITIIATVAMLNLVCLLNGMKRVVIDGELDTFMVQVLLCCLVLALNLPIYEGLFLRKDKGCISPPTTLASIGFALLACLFFII